MSISLMVIETGSEINLYSVPYLISSVIRMHALRISLWQEYFLHEEYKASINSLRFLRFGFYLFQAATT